MTRRFVILVGTQLGYGDLAQSMSECLDVNRKMADEYMRLRDVATSWKQKAKANSKDAKAGRRAQEELSKAQGDIAAILEEREVLIQQQREFHAKDDHLTTELNRVHRDYGNAIEDNTKLAANVETLEHKLTTVKSKLSKTESLLSMAEHHRNKAELDCEQAIFARDKAVTDQARDKAFYEAHITALSSPSVPTSQPDSEAPVKPNDAERAVLLTRIENLKKELSTRDTELAKLRSEVSLSDDVNTLRAELAEAKAVSSRLSGMYEQKSKDFRESELERLTLLGKQIIADGNALLKHD
jgi:chromosome segregation ATPase